MGGFFFKTGEFASLCGVKKDTLLHYDQIGVLKPEKTEDNGYRFYSTKQLYTFDLISALKRLGKPLSEIKSYLDQRNPEDFLALLHQQAETLAEEQHQLEILNQLLQETISMTQAAQRVIPGTFCLESCAESYYVAMRAADYTHYDEHQFLLSSRKLMNWARKHGGISLRLGDIVTQESIAAGLYVEDYYFCSVTEKTQAEDILTRPAGTYATLYHQGPYESLEHAYEQLVRWVSSQGYTPDGDLFEEDLLHYMSTADPNAYVMKISMKIHEASVPVVT